MSGDHYCDILQAPRRTRVAIFVDVGSSTVIDQKIRGACSACRSNETREITDRTNTSEHYCGIGQYVSPSKAKRWLTSYLIEKHSAAHFGSGVASYSYGVQSFKLRFRTFKSTVLPNHMLRTGLVLSTSLIIPS